MTFPYRTPITTMYNTIWGRIKRAASILFDRPIYYNDLYMDGEEQYGTLLKDMEALQRWEYREE